MQEYIEKHSSSEKQFVSQVRSSIIIYIVADPEKSELSYGEL